MALFAIWQGGAADGAALAVAAHVVPERVFSHRLETAQGAWNLWAASCASHFYRADAQVWIDPDGGACIIHGLIWRTGSAALIDARDIADLLDAPGARLPDDMAGEYAIARLHIDGTLEAFGDPAGLQQLFHAKDGHPILANRAGFVAALLGGRGPDRDCALWLGTIGYRIGGTELNASRTTPESPELQVLPEVDNHPNAEADRRLGRALATLEGVAE